MKSNFFRDWIVPLKYIPGLVLLLITGKRLIKYNK